MSILTVASIKEVKKRRYICDKKKFTVLFLCSDLCGKLQSSAITREEKFQTTATWNWQIEARTNFMQLVSFEKEISHRSPQVFPASMDQLINQTP